ncbi:ALF repeat-containing protein [Streptomyces sp. NPDC001523]|uniref:ALF repeat-containing protein n=1 Tax=Streptomyces sp. NPDC001523 TaxID=3154383 RepID=UPI0033328023
MREFLFTGQYTAARTDNRVKVFSLISVGGTSVKETGEKALATGTSEALNAFLKRGQHEARATDERVLTVSMLTSPNTGDEVKAAARIALAGPLASARFRAVRPSECPRQGRRDCGPPAADHNTHRPSLICRRRRVEERVEGGAVRSAGKDANAAQQAKWHAFGTFAAKYRQEGLQRQAEEEERIREEKEKEKLLAFGPRMSQCGPSSLPWSLHLCVNRRRRRQERRPGHGCSRKEPGQRTRLAVVMVAS